MGYTVFLDRDGVINQDSSDYIKTESEFIFIPGSLDAISLLSRNGFDIIVITNQSMINRKISSISNLVAIFNKMIKGVEQSGGHITDIFFCPHQPQDNCTCRKPLPGMIERAVTKYGIDLKTACMVGDSAKDIECAINAGCDKYLLVKTGNGQAAQETLSKKQIIPDFIAQDLFDAAQWIIRHLG